MDRRLYRAFWAFCLLSLLILPSPVCADGHFDMSGQSVSLYINKDGSFDIVDTRYYDGTSDGDILLEIGSTEYPGQASDIMISPVSTLFSAYTKVVSPDELRFGTYIESQEEDHPLMITLRPFERTDPSITLSYQVTGGIARYLDIADVRWAFGSETDSKPRLFDVGILLPSSTDMGDATAWIHTAYLGQPLVNTYQTINGRTRQLESSEELSIRCILPTGTIEGEIIPMMAGTEIHAQETELQQAYDDRVKTRNLRTTVRMLYLLLFQPLIAGLWLLAFYREYRKLKKDRERQGDPRTDIWSTPLPGRKPAMIPWLCSVPKERIRAASVIATFFDLARRGHIRIEEEKKVQAGLKDAAHGTVLYATRIAPEQVSDTLSDLESELLRILFPKGTGNGRTSFASMVDHLKERRPVSQWTAKGKKLSEAALPRSDERHPSVHWLYRSAAALLLTGSPVFILAVLLVPKLNKAPAQEHLKEEEYWHAVKQELLNLDKATHITSRHLREKWAQFLPIALATDQADGFIDLLPDMLSQSETMPNWYVRSGEVTFNTADIASFADKIHFIIDMMTEVLDQGKPKK